MPIGSLKNNLYGLALPLLGKKSKWKHADDPQLEKILKRHHSVGACIQLFENGKLTSCHAVGYAQLREEKKPVTEQTIFRTASVAKMVTALLVFRLQTLGKLHVQQDISELIGYPVQNPLFPHSPITLGMLLSHTSSIADSQAYFSAFQHKAPLKNLLCDPSAYLPAAPGTVFRYSNFAAGMVGCILEKQTGMSLEELAQRELFEPLGVQATFDASKLDPSLTADSYRVLPSGLAFDAQKRISSSAPLSQPDPEQHYLLASGNLYLTATDLAKLTLAAYSGANGFVDDASLKQMRTPLLGWPEKEVPMLHGMGLLKIEDP